MDHAPVGRCIYCGTVEGQLSDEHIIPYAIGGTAILANASCLTCAKVTSHIENECLNKMLKAARTQLGMRSRRKRPSTLELNARIGGHEAVLAVPIADHPTVLWLPMYDEPSILLGHHAPPPDGYKMNVWFEPLNLDIRKQLTRGVEGFSANFPVVYFARMLAKIGYSYAVSVLGVDGFNALVLNLIMGRKEYDGNFLVGGTLVQLPPAVEPNTHQLWIEFPRVNGREFVVAIVRLFAGRGAPLYRVVVGNR
jgi:hypothetical protein